MEKSDRLVLILLVVGVLALLLWMMRAANLFQNNGQPESGYGIGPGQTAPPIKADGWINGEPPSPEERRDKVVVVEAWAHWCWPCLQAAPEMVALHEKFRDEDVVFIGLCSEDESVLNLSQEFVAKAGFTWPNGYGAMETLIQFGSDYIPAVWVIGRDGKVTWNTGYEDIQPLESAIAQALAATPQHDAATQTGDKPTQDGENAAESSETPVR